MMNDELREKATKWAKRKFASNFKESELSDRSNEFPKFDYDEVEVGKVLGQGGFGIVYEVRGFHVDIANKPTVKGRSFRNLMAGNREPDKQVETGQVESRAFIAEHCIRNNGDSRYALKILSHHTVADPQLAFPGMLDMAIETRVLSDIEHPNIIKLRALAKCDAYNEKYFIVMDRLYDTLEHRIERKWRGRNRREHGVLRDRSGQKAKSLYEERITVAYELAHAVNYLHERRIIYRDIKPENIGFDIRDDVKLFDFGLAKELIPSIQVSPDTYKLTHRTGSPRYMAPEVANGDPYNEKCDCFSFAILLWEVLTCELPYAHKDMDYLENHVWTGPHERPPMQSDFHVPMKLLLTHSWGQDFHHRNSMKQNCEILRKECVRIRDGDESGLDHTRRRSTFVFRATNGQPPARSKRNLVKTNAMNRTTRLFDSE